VSNVGLTLLIGNEKLYISYCQVISDENKVKRFTFACLVKLYKDEFIMNWIKKGGKIENIFNLDETALFFKLQRNKTFASCAQEGKKVNKNQLTVAVICNALGRKYSYKTIRIFLKS
jgi:hypothetical protein